MKTAIIVILIFAGAATVYFTIENKKKNEEKQRQLDRESYRMEDERNEMQARSKWLRRTLDFEEKMNALLFRSGYTEKQRQDTIVAELDAMYFDTLRPYYNKQELKWYKEYRKERLQK